MDCYSGNRKIYVFGVFLLNKCKMDLDEEINQILIKYGLENSKKTSESNVKSPSVFERKIVVCFNILTWT